MYGDFNLINDEAQIDMISFNTNIAYTNYGAYIDGIGYSWDQNYHVNDNKYEGLLLSYFNTTTLDWIGYSLDGQNNITLLGHATIPMPTNGLHSLVISANNTSGVYFTSNNNKVIETTFEGNPEALQHAGKRLGGRLLNDDPSWDLSVAFDMLPRIPIRLRFNDKDDEFPAQTSILFRQSAESYIDMESLAIGGTYLTGMLTKE